MRKVLVANYFTDSMDPEVSSGSFPFATSELDAKADLIRHCTAELDNRFKDDNEAYQLRVVEEKNDITGEPYTAIDQVFDDDLDDMGEEAWSRYFIIEQIDHL